MRIWFFQPFFATWLVKMWNIILFLTFSTFCPGSTHKNKKVVTYQYFMSKFPLYCNCYTDEFFTSHLKFNTTYFLKIKWYDEQALSSELTILYLRAWIFKMASLPRRETGPLIQMTRNSALSFNEFPKKLLVISWWLDSSDNGSAFLFLLAKKYLLF